MMHLIKTIFQLHAILMWTINNFPVYVDLPGWSTKDMSACPCCITNTNSCYLKHGCKVYYMGHRHCLDSDHEFWKEDTKFDTESLFRHYLGKKAQATFKKRKEGEENIGAWNKRSTLFTLPY